MRVTETPFTDISDLVEKYNKTHVKEGDGETLQGNAMRS